MSTTKSGSSLQPLRSVLYVPASNSRALARAATVPADALILDLEDAVAPDAKESARAAVGRCLADPAWTARTVAVRVNGLDTPWGLADLAAVAHVGARIVLFPKIDGADELRAAIARLDAAGGGDAEIWAMIETPRSVLRVAAIAACGPRLTALVMGTADLAKALRVPPEASRIGLLTALGHSVLGARAEGVDILDGVFGDLRDAAGFRAACLQGRAMGFDGKTLIHPDQVEIANEIFGVSEEQAAAAQRLIEAWEAAAAAGRGVAVLDGRMVERLHAEEARRLLALRAQTAGGGRTVQK